MARLDVAQLHGEETPQDYPALVAVWKAARVTDRFDLAALEQCPAEALVLDGPAGDLYGGAGKVFDWRCACSRVESAPGKKDLGKMTAFLAAAKAALVA